MEVQSDDERVKVVLQDWDTLYAITKINKASLTDLKMLLEKSAWIDQAISISVAGDVIAEIENGKLNKWKALPALKLFLSYLRN